MEEEKTSRIRLGVLLLICTVSLLGTISLGIVKETFFNQSFLLEQTKKTEYSKLVANEISQNDPIHWAENYQSAKIFEKIIWKKVNM